MGGVLSGRQHGTYVLIFRLPNIHSIRVGRIGEVTLTEGAYAYVGSALGPGGLGGRLGRHVKAIARPHWHIDYLRPMACLEQIWVTAKGQRREHDWARLLREWRGASIAVRRFGASDCSCETHLFRWLERPDLATFQRLVRNHFSGDGPVRAIKWSSGERALRFAQVEAG